MKLLLLTSLLLVAACGGRPIERQCLAFTEVKTTVIDPYHRSVRVTTKQICKDYRVAYKDESR